MLILQIEIAFTNNLKTKELLLYNPKTQQAFTANKLVGKHAPSLREGL
jgi:hypothetical protein